MLFADRDPPWAKDSERPSCVYQYLFPMTQGVMMHAIRIARPWGVQCELRASSSEATGIKLPQSAVHLFPTIQSQPTSRQSFHRVIQSFHRVARKTDARAQWTQRTTMPKQGSVSRRSHNVADCIIVSHHDFGGDFSVDCVSALILR